MFLVKGVLLFICLKGFCDAQFLIPEVMLEAYEPKGFKASIPADNLTQLFGFHGKVNDKIQQIEPGSINGDITKQADKYLTYYDPDLKLKVGDNIYYWFTVQHNQLQYRKDGQKWTVERLLQGPGTGCQATVSKVSDRTNVCKDAVVFEDDFSILDERNWTIQQYLPARPDYEFVLYKKDPEVTFINDNKLRIKPKFRENKNELKRKESISVDLEGGCTKEGLCNNETFIIKNPVISGRLESRLTFSYGDFEIKARLPSGDWIFPEIFLEDQESRKILIAYTRGNQHLTGNNNDDLGNSLLFGGPVDIHNEPYRSRKLSSYNNNKPLSESSHVYRLRWTPNLLELFIDDQRYGEVATEPYFTGENPSKFRLVLGVGVGGLHHFPDGYKSGENKKPWKNGKTTQVSDFFDDSSTWYPTWTEEGRQLHVDYVKVTAI